MSDPLEPGNRMRVTESNRVEGYGAGDKGMVQAVASIPAIGDQLQYQAAMDRDDGVGRVVVTAEEIELDAGPIRSLAGVTILSEDEQRGGSEDRLESKLETTS